VDLEKPSLPEPSQNIEPPCWPAGDQLFEVRWTFLSDDARNGDPFCRKGFSHCHKVNRVGKRRLHLGRELWFTCTHVAASREVLPGRQDLPKSATAPVNDVWDIVDGCTISM
jgi:hypothetical protein